MADLLLHALATIGGAVIFGFGVLTVMAGDKNQAIGCLVIVIGAGLLCVGLFT